MRNKLILCILTICLMAVLGVAILLRFSTQENMPLSIQVLYSDKTETINLWEAEDGNLYAFLPSYAASAQISFQLNTNNNVYCDGKLIENGMPCNPSSEEEIHTLTYTEWGKERSKNVVFMTSANVPAMYIDTQSGSMEYIHQKKGNEETAVMRLYTSGGAIEFDGDLQSIKGRGNSTWTMSEKKPYGIKLEKAEELLGIGTAENWVLLSQPNDYSNIRNKIVFDAASALGLKFTPDTEWVDLYLNGEYVGLYLLSERNEVHQERVDIATDGSFLVSGEMESRLVEQSIQFISTDAKQAFRIHYPKVLSHYDISKLSQTLQSVENSIVANDSIDPVSGKSLEELIDVESFARKYLVDEVFGNIDGGVFSQYYYIDGSDPSGKLYAGPVWDYDLTMGSDYMWQSGNPEAMYSNRPRIKEGIDSVWVYGLCQKEDFYNRVIELYQTEVSSFLDKQFYENIKSYEDAIITSAAMDYVRWGIDKEFEASVDYLLEYMEDRKAFLDSLWLLGEKYYCVTLVQGNQNNNAYYMVREGECVKEIPVLNDTNTIRYLGWYYSDTDEPFDINKPITEDTEIYAKWEEKSTSKIKQVVKLAPLGAIGLMGLALLVADIKKQRGSK